MISILYRYNIDIVSIRDPYCIDTVSILYMYCTSIDTASILYRYSIDAVSPQVNVPHTFPKMFPALFQTYSPRLPQTSWT